MSKITTTLITLNEVNGADLICDKYERQCLTEFDTPLIGVIFGVPFGGDVERLSRTWNERKGQVYGYDTFTGHPKQLAPSMTDYEATCMDHWYGVYGMDKTTIEYQRQELDKMGLTNAFLVKGLVNKDSCKDLPYINYAFLDMDILESMQLGFKAVKHKIVKGDYLLMHDINNIERLITWWKDIVLKDPAFEEIETPRALTGVLRKK